MALGTVPSGGQEELTVELVAPDGSLLIQSKVDGLRNELRWLPAGGSAHVVVHDFGAAEPEGQPEWQVVNADFDGRYVAYSTSDSPSASSSALYVWDSATGRASEQVTDDPHSDPLAYDGQVFWVQATGAGPEPTALYRFDIATGTRDVVREGRFRLRFRMGPLLIWSEDTGDDHLTRLHAMSLETGEESALPDQLADLVDPGFIDAGDEVVAWTDPELRDLNLWVWRTSWPQPVQVLAMTDIPVEWIHVAGDIVAWSHRELGQHAFDTRTGGYAQLTPEWGGNDSGGTRLLIGFLPDLSSGKDDAVSRQTVIDTAALPPLPGCDGT